MTDQTKQQDDSGFGSYAPPPGEAQSAQRTPTTDAVQRSSHQSPTVLDVINLLADKSDPLIKLVSTSVDRYQRGQERQIRFQVHMSWVAVSVVFLVIGVAAWLTYLGKVDGSTFTFLLGLIVGYVLTFVRDQIKSPET